MRSSDEVLLPRTEVNSITETMTYGKLFSSLYTGSMIGAGAVPFALMPYIISNANPDRTHGGYIELNPVLLSAIIGVSEKEIEEGIEFLCAPDPKSRTPDEDGRRLIQISPFAYRVVNYAKYKAIRDEEDRREQNRLSQETFRKKKKLKEDLRAMARRPKPLPGETAYVKTHEDEGQEAADSALDREQR